MLFLPAHIVVEPVLNLHVLVFLTLEVAIVVSRQEALNGLGAVVT